MTNQYGNAGQAGDWERNLASLIANTNSNLGSQTSSTSRLHIPPPPPPARRTDAAMMHQGQAIGSLPTTSHQSAAVATFHSTRSAGVRPMPKMNEDAMSRRIEGNIRRSVEKFVKDKLAAVDIVRGQVATLSDDVGQQIKDVANYSNTQQQQVRALDALKHEVGSRRDLLAKLEASTAGETAWHSSVNSALALLRQTVARQQEEIMSRASAVEVKSIVDSVHITATSSVSAAIVPMQAGIQDEMKKMRAEMRSLRQENAKMREALDTVGICGSNSLRNQSLNDGIKSICAHAVAIQCNEVENGIMKSVRTLQETVDRMQSEKEQSARNLETNLERKVSEGLESRVKKVVRGWEEAQRNQQAITEEMSLSIRKEELDRSKAISELEQRLVSSVLPEQCVKICMQASEKTSSHISQDEVMRLIGDAEERMMSSTLRFIADKKVLPSSDVEEQVASLLEAYSSHTATLERMVRTHSIMVAELKSMKATQGKMLQDSKSTTDYASILSEHGQKIGSMKKTTQSLCESLNSVLDVVKQAAGRIDLHELKLENEAIVSKDCSSPCRLDIEQVKSQICNEVSSHMTEKMETLLAKQSEATSASKDLVTSADFGSHKVAVLSLIDEAKKSIGSLSSRLDGQIIESAEKMEALSALVAQQSGEFSATKDQISSTYTSVSKLKEDVARLTEGSARNHESLCKAHSSLSSRLDAESLNMTEKMESLSTTVAKQFEAFPTAKDQVASTDFSGHEVAALSLIDEAKKSIGSLSSRLDGQIIESAEKIESLSALVAQQSDAAEDQASSTHTSVSKLKEDVARLSEDSARSHERLCKAHSSLSSSLSSRLDGQATESAEKIEALSTLVAQQSEATDGQFSSMDSKVGKLEEDISRLAEGARNHESQATVRQATTEEELKIRQDKDRPDPSARDQSNGALGTFKSAYNPSNATNSTATSAASNSEAHRFLGIRMTRRSIKEGDEGRDALSYDASTSRDTETLQPASMEAGSEGDDGIAEPSPQQGEDAPHDLLKQSPEGFLGSSSNSSSASPEDIPTAKTSLVDYLIDADVDGRSAASIAEVMPHNPTALISVDAEGDDDDATSSMEEESIDTILSFSLDAEESDNARHAKEPKVGHAERRVTFSLDAEEFAGPLQDPSASLVVEGKPNESKESLYDSYDFESDDGAIRHLLP